MARLIALVGRSGTGKSTSIFPEKSVGIKGLDPKETILINVSGKALPSKNSQYKSGKIVDGGNYFETNSPENIKTVIESVDSKYPNIKNIIIDDAVYLQLITFMDKITQKGYEKFNDIAQAIYEPIKAAAACSRKDLNIVFMFHPEKDNEGLTKIKTAGKMVDQYVNIEGMFTFVLYSNNRRNFTEKKNEYFFETQSDGFNTAKSPLGCFDKFEIPNDLGYVVDAINNYYK